MIAAWVAWMPGSLPLSCPGKSYVTADDELRCAGAPVLGLGTPTDKVVSEVVEGGAEVRERVANHEAPFGWGVHHVGAREREAIRVRIELFPEPKRWFKVEVSTPRIDASLECVHVFFRPVKFVPASLIKFVHFKYLCNACKAG
jgi:hypothetical protein